MAQNSTDTAIEMADFWTQVEKIEENDVHLYFTREQLSAICDLEIHH